MYQHKYIIIGDLHLTKENHQDILNVLKQQLEDKTGKIILLGDIFNSNRISAIAAIEISKALKNIINDYYILVGNHDYYSKDVSLCDIFPSNNIIKDICIKEDILFIPYMTEPDTDLIKYFLLKNNINYIFLHYDILHEHKELLSFLLDENAFIIGGHLHKFIKRNKLIYPGAFYFNSFNEANQTEAYYLGITKENEIKIYKHTSTPIYLRIPYNECDINKIKSLKYPHIYLRLIVSSKEDINKIYQQFKSLKNISVDFKVVFNASDYSAQTPTNIDFNINNIINKTLKELNLEQNQRLTVYLNKYIRGCSGLG